MEKRNLFIPAERQKPFVTHTDGEYLHLSRDWKVGEVCSYSCWWFFNVGQMVAGSSNDVG